MAFFSQGAANPIDHFGPGPGTDPVSGPTSSGSGGNFWANITKTALTSLHAAMAAASAPQAKAPITINDVLTHLALAAQNSQSSQGGSPYAALLAAGQQSASAAPMLDLGQVAAPYDQATALANKQNVSQTALLNTLHTQGQQQLAQGKASDNARVAALAQVAQQVAAQRQAATTATYAAAAHSLQAQGVDPAAAAGLVARGQSANQDNGTLAALMHQQVVGNQQAAVGQEALSSQGATATDQAARVALGQSLDNILSQIGMKKASALSSATQQNASIAASNNASANSARANNAQLGLKMLEAQQSGQNNWLSQANVINQMMSSMPNNGQSMKNQAAAQSAADGYAGGGSQSDALFNAIVNSSKAKDFTTANALIPGLIATDKAQNGSKSYGKIITPSLISSWLKQYYTPAGLSSDAVGRINPYMASLGIKGF